MQLSMFSLGAPPASHSPSPDAAREWMTRVVHSCSSTLPLLAALGPDGWSGRTSPVSCLLTAGGRLAPCSGGWQTSGMGSPTAFLTLSTSDWPSDGSACSLSAVLETGDVPQRFFLSARACQGILRRAEKRGKLLARSLAAAVQAVASGQTSTVTAASQRTNERTNERTNVPPISMCLNAGAMGRIDAESETLIPTGGFFDVAHTLRAGGFDASEDGTGRGTPLRGEGATGVRRLAPRECERLQGFPDDYTLVPYRGKPAADSPRYRAIGNSMAVQVVRWIGRRIQAVDTI